MKKDVRHYFEPGADRRDEELAALLEQAICEGVFCSKPIASESPAHLFGRHCERFLSGNFSGLKGLAATGVRTAAFFDEKSLRQSISQLEEMARQHIPAVFHVPAIPAAAPSGCFQVVATTAQEAVDWTLIAHKVAEQALMPGFVACPHAGTALPVLLPNRDIRDFLGEADDWIPSPTPAQRMVFGKNRRRIPNWFHSDFSVLLGASKDSNAQALESAANERFFRKHLKDIFANVMAEFASYSGRSYSAIQSHQLKDAEYVVVVQGAGYQQAVQAVDQLRKERVRAGCLHLNIPDPFPQEELAALLSGKKGVTVLEVSPGGNSLPEKIRLAAKYPAAFFSGKGKSEWTVDGIVAAIRNMTPSGARNTEFFLDIPFTKSSSASAQHEVLLHAISREYPGIEGESILSVQEKTRPAPASIGLPESIRRHKDQGPPYSKLSRFFHDTASFYGPGQAGSDTADPFQALPLVPAETALFADMSRQRTQLPELNGDLCTGCGACMVHCPHAALPSLSIRLESLLKSGMEMTSAASLTPLIKNLARLASQEIHSLEGRTVKLQEIVHPAFEKLASQMKMEGDKLQNARQDLEKLLQSLDDYQGISTDTFFGQPETQEKGSGELFSLLVNPHSCTACGVCVEVCPEDAFKLVPQTPDLLEDYVRKFRLWEQLPDTASGTIERLSRDHDYDPLAAVLLSRYFYQSMAGGSASEAGAPAKAMLHLVAALTESAAQPHLLGWISELTDLADTLGQNIHAKLSAALPGDDSAALRKALLDAKGRKLPLDELVGSLGSEQHLQMVDTAQLQRKIQLESNLKDLRWALADGPAGTGRARYGIVSFSEDLPWLDEYPYQPFSVPVWRCDAGQGMAEVSGLIRGQIRNLLDEVKLLRRAKLEIRDAYRPEIHDAQIASLTWEELDEKERRLLPPMLVVADAKKLSGAGIRQILEWLSSDWPVKVVLLNDGLTDPAGHATGVEGLLFSAMNLRKPLVFQGNLHARRRFFKGLVAGLQSPGPALFHLLAPQPEQHNIPASGWADLYRMALKTRAFPSLLFEPRAEMAFFSEGLSLKGNPEEELPFSAWLQTQRAWNGKSGDQATEATQRQWKTWQELAGAISAFPGNLRAQTESELKKQFEKEIEVLKAAYEAKLQEQEASSMERVKEKLREKLLKLSGTKS